jgi:hypothetical protein
MPGGHTQRDKERILGNNFSLAADKRLVVFLDVSVVERTHRAGTVLPFTDLYDLRL